MITIREREERDCAGIARVRIDAWRGAYRGIVPDAYLAGLSYAADEARFVQRYHETRGDKTIYFFVAVDPSERVIGFATGGKEREGFPGYPGELYALYILPEYQGHGVGRLLARAVFSRLEADGLTPVIIWALKDNLPASGFYIHLGGQVVGEKSIEIGGKRLVEVGFGYERNG